MCYIIYCLWTLEKCLIPFLSRFLRQNFKQHLRYRCIVSNLIAKIPRTQSVICVQVFYIYTYTHTRACTHPQVSWQPINDITHSVCFDSDFKILSRRWQHTPTIIISHQFSIVHACATFNVHMFVTNCIVSSYEFYEVEANAHILHIWHTYLQLLHGGEISVRHLLWADRTTKIRWYAISWKQIMYNVAAFVGVRAVV